MSYFKTNLLTYRTLDIIPRVRWDASNYDRQFSYVTRHGAELIDLLAAQPGERILDLGCGTGHQAAELAGRDVHVVGLDADEAMIERARAAHPAVTFMRADAQRLRRAGPLAEGFDAVVSNAALHWMPDQDAVLTGARSVLDPGGRLIAEQGGVGNIAAVWSALSAARTDLGLPIPQLPWTFPSPGEQAARLERCGFQVRALELFERPTPLAPGASLASWVEMFAPQELAVDAEIEGRLRERVDAHGRSLGLFADQQWIADYVRLRFVAIAR